MLGVRKTILRREEKHKNSSNLLSLWCPVMKDDWLSAKTQDMLWYIKTAENIISHRYWCLNLCCLSRSQFVNR